MVAYLACIQNVNENRKNLFVYKFCLKCYTTKPHETDTTFIGTVTFSVTAATPAVTPCANAFLLSKFKHPHVFYDTRILVL